jgi:hypothetical protein
MTADGLVRLARRLAWPMTPPRLSTDSVGRSGSSRRCPVLEWVAVMPACRSASRSSASVADRTRSNGSVRSLEVTSSSQMRMRSKTAWRQVASQTIWRGGEEYGSDNHVLGTSAVRRSIDSLGVQKPTNVRCAYISAWSIELGGWPRRWASSGEVAVTHSGARERPLRPGTSYL